MLCLQKTLPKGEVSLLSYKSRHIASGRKKNEVGRDSIKERSLLFDRRDLSFMEDEVIK
jgi:hypothetical protein